MEVEYHEFIHGKLISNGTDLEGFTVCAHTPGFVPNMVGAGQAATRIGRPKDIERFSGSFALGMTRVSGDYWADLTRYLRSDVVDPRNRRPFIQEHHLFLRLNDFRKLNSNFRHLINRRPFHQHIQTYESVIQLKGSPIIIDDSTLTPEAEGTKLLRLWEQFGDKADVIQLLLVSLFGERKVQILEFPDDEISRLDLLELLILLIPAELRLRATFATRVFDSSLCPAKIRFAFAANDHIAINWNTGQVQPAGSLQVVDARYASDVIRYLERHGAEDLALQLDLLSSSLPESFLVNSPSAATLFETWESLTDHRMWRPRLSCGVSTPRACATYLRDQRLSDSKQVTDALIEVAKAVLAGEQREDSALIPMCIRQADSHQFCNEIRPVCLANLTQSTELMREWLRQESFLEDVACQTLAVDVLTQAFYTLGSDGALTVMNVVGELPAGDAEPMECSDLACRLLQSVAQQAQTPEQSRLLLDLVFRLPTLSVRHVGAILTGPGLPGLTATTGALRTLVYDQLTDARSEEVDLVTSYVETNSEAYFYGVIGLAVGSGKLELITRHVVGQVRKEFEQQPDAAAAYGETVTKLVETLVKGNDIANLDDAALCDLLWLANRLGQEEKSRSVFAQYLTEYGWNDCLETHVDNLSTEPSDRAGSLLRYLVRDDRFTALPSQTQFDFCVKLCNLLKHNETSTVVAAYASDLLSRNEAEASHETLATLWCYHLRGWLDNTTQRAIFVGHLFDAAIGENRLPDFAAEYADWIISTRDPNLIDYLTDFRSNAAGETVEALETLWQQILQQAPEDFSIGEIRQRIRAAATDKLVNEAISLLKDNAPPIGGRIPRYVGFVDSDMFCDSIRKAYFAHPNKASRLIVQWLQAESFRRDGACQRFVCKLVDQLAGQKEGGEAVRFVYDVGQVLTRIPDSQELWSCILSACAQKLLEPVGTRALIQKVFLLPGLEAEDVASLLQSPGLRGLPATRNVLEHLDQATSQELAESVSEVPSPEYFYRIVDMSVSAGNTTIADDTLVSLIYGDVKEHGNRLLDWRDTLSRLIEICGTPPTVDHLSANALCNVMRLANDLSKEMSFQQAFTTHVIRFGWSEDLKRELRDYVADFKPRAGLLIERFSGNRQFASLSAQARFNHMVHFGNALKWSEDAKRPILRHLTELVTQPGVTASFDILQFILRWYRSEEGGGKTRIRRMLTAKVFTMALVQGKVVRELVDWYLHWIFEASAPKMLEDLAELSPRDRMTVFPELWDAVQNREVTGDLTTSRTNRLKHKIAKGVDRLRRVSSQIDGDIPTLDSDLRLQLTSRIASLWAHAAQQIPTPTSYDDARFWRLCHQTFERCLADLSLIPISTSLLSSLLHWALGAEAPSDISKWVWQIHNTYETYVTANWAQDQRTRDRLETEYRVSFRRALQRRWDEWTSLEMGTELAASLRERGINDEADIVESERDARYWARELDRLGQTVRLLQMSRFTELETPQLERVAEQLASQPGDRVAEFQTSLDFLIEFSKRHLRPLQEALRLSSQGNSSEVA